MEDGIRLERMSRRCRMINCRVIGSEIIEWHGMIRWAGLDLSGRRENGAMTRCSKWVVVVVKKKSGVEVKSE